MADITKCQGIGCPSKEECYRFKAEENSFRQSYFVNAPYELKESGDVICKYFWSMEKLNG